MKDTIGMFPGSVFTLTMGMGNQFFKYVFTLKESVKITYFYERKRWRANPSL